MLTSIDYNYYNNLIHRVKALEISNTLTLNTLDTIADLVGVEDKDGDVLVHKISKIIQYGVMHEFDAKLGSINYCSTCGGSKKVGHFQNCMFAIAFNIKKI